MDAPMVRLLAQKWEHKVIESNSPLPVKKLNDMGMEGWEMCGVTDKPEKFPLPSLFIYYFKRPL